MVLGAYQVAKNRRVQKNNKKSGNRAAAPSARSAGANRTPEIVGVLGIGVSVFLILALVSLSLGSGGLVGPFGRAAADLLYGWFGLLSYVIAGGLAVISVRLLLDKEPLMRATTALGLALGSLSLAILLALMFPDYLVGGHGPGGSLGGNVGGVLRSVVSTAGTALLAFIGLVLAVVVATPLSLRELVPPLARRAKSVSVQASGHLAASASKVGSFAGEVVRAVLPERDPREYDWDENDYYDEQDLDEAAVAELNFIEPPIIDARTGPIDASAVEGEIDDNDTEVTPVVELTESDKKTNKKKKKGKAKTRKTSKTTPGVAVGETPAESEALEPGQEASVVVAEEPADIPLIVESEFKGKGAAEIREQEKKLDAQRLDFIPLGDGEYKMPPVNLLDYDDSTTSEIDRDAMLELSAKLTQTLENYGVKGKVAAIRPGPVVTMYEFAPAPGTRISKITRLADDLAMSLEALKVRIVAPIPGKAAVGIEVPNKSREMVYLKEIIADQTFQDSKMKLPMALGKNIEGAPVTVDLGKMPHLLVAGTTGSGKSVAVNSMITSLLYNSTPEDVRVIMVDPKMLELSIYEGIPHLLLPVVTDPKKANLALKWAVEEMERRYDLLAKMGVRDIASYNKKLAKKQVEYTAVKLQAEADHAAFVAKGEGELEAEAQLDLPLEPARKLPYIVVIIDEFADLIMCAPKEVETSVARIAQKARAAGIHLILATQRPSVNVITGLIKANFPSRIAFRVASKVDSRTILDQGGAESLLGAGDMLFSDRGAAPDRLHGCFVGEEEIHRIVDFLKTQARPVYNLEILKPRDDEDEGGEGGEKGPADEMYDRAVQIVAEAQRVSISYLQRRLSVGYNRSAKMVERMESEGVVSAPDNKKVREVLISQIDAA